MNKVILPKEKIYSGAPVLVNGHYPLAIMRMVYRNGPETVRWIKGTSKRQIGRNCLIYQNVTIGEVGGKQDKRINLYFSRVGRQGTLQAEHGSREDTLSLG